MSLKDKIYNCFVRNNECVQYEYERYVNEHLADHYIHRFSHVKLLIQLNIHYRIKKKKTPMLYWDKEQEEATTDNKECIKEIDAKESKQEKPAQNLKSNSDQIKCSEKSDTEIFYVRNPICIRKGCKVLFVSATGRGERPILDPSTRYRCFHPAEELTRVGIYSTVISASEFVKQTVPLDYDLYVFHRPTKAEEQQINILKKYNKAIIADYDDLIFGEESIAKESSIYKNKVASLDECIKIYKNNLDALKLFDVFTCSTSTLGQYIKKYKSDAKVFLIHNFLPYSIITKTEKYVNATKDADHIMYCCGTISHNKDFCEWEEEIIKSLKNDTKLKMTIIGPLDASGEINRLPNVTFHKALDYWDMFDYMKDAAFTIAPLERSVFNQCKSNVKFLEAAAVGANIIATPIEDMCRVGDSGIVLCDDPREFEQIIRNRKDHVNGAISLENREYILENGSTKTFLQEFKAVIEYLER